MTTSPIPLETLDPAKFQDPEITANGERRAKVALGSLATLWINTGTLCNLTCAHCYIESSPTNDRLVYITAAEVAVYFDEIAESGLGTREIGFTGGEPFMNPDFLVMLEDALTRGFKALVLTNAMHPLRKCQDGLARLNEKFGARLAIRVSIDHYSQTLHELERGTGSWAPTMDGLGWLVDRGFNVRVAGRTMWAESEAKLRQGYGKLFAARGIPVDADDREALVLFPEMDERADVAEITDACWEILDVDPDTMMCASSRMVVKRKGASTPTVLACTLLAYDPRFEMGPRLADAMDEISLNHPHCARFCVLGGGSCSRPEG